MGRAPIRACCAIALREGRPAADAENSVASEAVEHSSEVSMSRAPAGAAASHTVTPGADPDTPPLIERVLAPFQRFARTESASGLVLLACTALALAWANSPWADYTRISGRRR